MPRAPRAGSFLFEPRAFLNDPAVLAMTECELGAYIRLMCEAWEMAEPGVVPADDRSLAALSRTGEKWAQYRDAVARAFDTETRPGWWVQKRLSATHRLQSRRFSSKSSAGRVAAKKRWANGLNGSPIGYPIQGSVSVLVSDTDTAKEQPPTPSAKPRVRKPRAYTEHPEFERFYRTYPRRIAREEAAKAFSKTLRDHPDWTPDEVIEAAACFAKDVAGKEAEFIPYPGTWLNGARYRDQEVPNGAQTQHSQQREVGGRAALGAPARGVLERLGLVDSHG